MAVSRRRRSRSKKPSHKPLKPGAAARRAPTTASRPVSERRDRPERRERRRARHVIRRFDVWSVLRFSVVFYLTLACIIFVAGVVLWLAATAVGVRENIERFVGDLIASKEFRFVGSEVLRVAALCAVVMVLLGTAFNVFLAVVYNLISDLVGGVAVMVDNEVPEAQAGAPPVMVLPASEVAGRPRGVEPGGPASKPAAAP